MKDKNSNSCCRSQSLDVARRIRAVEATREGWERGGRGQVKGEGQAEGGRREAQAPAVKTKSRGSRRSRSFAVAPPAFGGVPGERRTGGRAEQSRAAKRKATTRRCAPSRPPSSSTPPLPRSARRTPPAPSAGDDGAPATWTTSTKTTTTKTTITKRQTRRDEKKEEEEDGLRDGRSGPEWPPTHPRR